MVAAGQLPARPGIARIIAEAQDAGWMLAVCSTSAEPSVRAILDHVAGPDRAARFDLVLAGDVVAHKKPAPDIYLLALERLGATPVPRLVIEDSRNGLLAAVGAGLRCVVTVNGYTEDEDASEAVMVVTSLGDPGGALTVRPGQPKCRNPGRLGHPARPRGLPRNVVGSKDIGRVDALMLWLSCRDGHGSRANARSPAHRCRAGARAPIPHGAAAAIATPDDARSRP